MKFAPNLFLVWSSRLLIFIVMVVAVITVIYFTPYPSINAEFKSCDRKCHELEWPMICRFRLKLESRKVLPSYCRNCSQNFDACLLNGCANLNHRSLEIVTTANGHVVGPHFHVCANDVVVVDVINKLPSSRSVTIHWKGQSQKGSQVMDGVPMVTQCPILSATTFQYKFRAVDPGTHTWHLYADDDSYDGSSDLFGMLVVRQSFRQDVLKFLYDTDRSSHVMTISTKKFAAGNLKFLINGRIADATAMNRENLNYWVEPGLYHRFRVAVSHNVASINCPVELSVTEHTLIVVSLDGNPIKPLYSDSVTILAGDRVDFILHANKQPAADMYRIQIATEKNCSSSPASYRPQQAWATVRYNNSMKNQRKSSVLSEKPIEILQKVNTLAATARDGGNSSMATFSRITGWDSLPSNFRKRDIDQIIRLVYHHSLVPNIQINSSDDNHSSQEFVDDTRIISCVNNVTFVYPSSPLISQLAEIPNDLICDTQESIEDCATKKCCSCVRVIHIAKGSLVDVVLSNRASSRSSGDLHQSYLTFHLHGHKFYLIGRFNNHAVDQVERNFTDELQKSNLNDATLRDTVSVPNDGTAIIRFEANNAGYWMLGEMTGNLGMNVILHVGEEHHLPTIPSNFPRCGNFIGPKYFLT